ncbi:50S ribosomal protein L37e [Candidatus Woesearchaeota archaeon]|nr:50S ribosomal protein L37e [Candidatus Woesearchaeota archaeon]
MTKGTASKGEKSGKRNMVFCRRCGRRSFHVRKKKCSKCGYGASARMRTYKWKKVGKR